MRWEPNDVIRLAALLGALVLCVIGALMMWQGVSGEGVIDIKSSILSGSLKSGSAGLFIVFLAFMVIAFVLLTPSSSKDPMAHLSPSTNRAAAIARGFFLLLCSFLASGALAAFGYGTGFGLLALALGAMTALAGIAYMQYL